ncbi:hypothetical protein [Streptomyces sp. NPDC050704]|uniref:hypothetical protein n=1 Tax=Streptomyces sp. NPDC050704 TaxID=3157219 RepID=UPI0034179B67
MTTGLASRAARAAIFAAVCVLTAALGHAWASGVSPSWFVLGSAFIGMASAAWWVAGRERGALVVTGSTVVAQLGLHSLFGLLRPAPTASVSDMEHVELMKRMSHEQLMEHMDSMSGMGGMSGMDMSSMGMMAPGGHTSTPMFAAHSLAALVCGLWLWRGESAAFRLGRVLAAAVFVPLRLALRITGPVPRPQPPERPVTPRPARKLRAALLQHVVSRRGPPGYVAHC